MAKKKPSALSEIEQFPLSGKLKAMCLPIMILIGLVVALTLPRGRTSSDPAPVATVSSPTSNVAPVMTMVIDNPTPEQHKFIQGTFFKSWNRIRSGYPIPDLRQRFDRLLKRVESTEIRLQFGSRYCDNRLRVLAEADREGRQAVIRFYTPAIQDLYKRVTSEEMREDIIIGLLLHEEYHIDKHVFAPIRGERPEHIKALREGETWWWCAETIYTPMLQIGRLREIPPDDTINSVLRCYKLANGDPLSEPWIRFVLADPTLKHR